MIRLEKLNTQNLTFASEDHKMTISMLSSPTPVRFEIILDGDKLPPFETFVGMETFAKHLIDKLELETVLS